MFALTGTDCGALVESATILVDCDKTEASTLDPNDGAVDDRKVVLRMPATLPILRDSRERLLRLGPGCSFWSLDESPRFPQMSYAAC